MYNEVCFQRITLSRVHGMQNQMSQKDTKSGSSRKSMKVAYFVRERSRTTANKRERSRTKHKEFAFVRGFTLMREEYKKFIVTTWQVMKFKKSNR